MKQGHKRIASLEVGRGFASTLVVLHHAGSIVTQPRFYGATGFGGALEFFYVGVDFFFVLSGFIIAWVHWDDLGKPSRLGTYAKKRFLRIYPPYWGVLLPLIALYFLIPSSGLDSQRDPVNLVMSLLLLPYPMPPVLGVAWTLVHEIFFYAVFAVILAIGRRGLWLMPVWGLAIVAASFFGPLPHLPGFVLSPFNIEFILGVGAAVLLRHRTIPMPGLVAGLGIAAFLLCLFVPSLASENRLVQRLVYGLAAAAFVLGMVEIEWRRPLKLPSALIFFGAASYAVYLVHPIAVSMSIQVLTRLSGRSLPIEAAILLISLVGLVAGMVYHAVVERRLSALGRAPRMVTVPER